MQINQTFHEFIEPVQHEGFRGGWYIGMGGINEGWWVFNIRKGKEWPRTKDIEINDFLDSLREIKFVDGRIDEMHIDFVDTITCRLRIKLAKSS